MGKEILGIILSIIIMLVLYYCSAKYLKTLNIELPSFMKKFQFLNFFSKKESMQNRTSEEKDPLEKTIMKTQKFSCLPTAFSVENKDASFLSFLTRFDPSFKPPNYKEFPFKSTLYTVDYKCRPSATGMFTDCGPNAPNSCA